MNKQIAVKLAISEITVKVHRANAMQKMGRVRWRNWSAWPMRSAFANRSKHDDRGLPGGVKGRL
jgi:hypothetical protein